MNFLRRNRFIIGLLVVAGIVRFVTLLLSQTHVTSDQAIVGLMAKHILEHRYFPFYLYGVSYSGSGAWEAYLAALPFVFFGVGVIALKSCTVILSLLCLALFYAMAERLYDRRVAALSTVVLALWPGLLKWHFDPKGYAFYFLSIPLLLLLFHRLETRRERSTANALLFGLVCGASIWCLELSAPIVASLWILLLLRRQFRNLAICLGGFLVGYGPALWWNLANNCANWRFLFQQKLHGEALGSRFAPSVWSEIFIRELPKFFGPDTLLWYYPETSWIGWSMYAVTVLAVGLAASSALRPLQVRAALKEGFTSDRHSDLLMLILVGACFMPYLVAPLRVAGYFLGASFFMSILIVRFVVTFFHCPKLFPRVAAALVLATVTVCGIATIVRTATHNQIETLVLRTKSWKYAMARIPGKDIDAVEGDLAEHRIRSIWTGISFVYPLIFESNEKLVASESIFGVERSFYPPEIPKAEPGENDPAVFVIETDSPLRAEVEAACANKGGAPPRIAQYGTLTVVEEQFAAQ